MRISSFANHAFADLVLDGAPAGGGHLSNRSSHPGGRGPGGAGAPIGNGAIGSGGVPGPGGGPAWSSTNLALGGVMVRG